MTSASEFAVYPRSPGERIPLRPEQVPPPDPPASPAVAVAVPNPPQQLPKFDPPPEHPLLAVVRAYLDDRPDVAIETLKTLDRPNQELLLQLVPALATAYRTDLARTDLGALQRQLDAAAASLAARAPLDIDKACFCRSVRTFGAYDPVPDRPTFAPNTPTTLYAELKNVPSDPVDTPGGPGYVTNLVCTMRVEDAAGNVVEFTVPGPNKTWQTVPQHQETKKDFRRTPVRDYFVTFNFSVPSRPGAYTVKIDVRDPANGRAVTRTMPFRVQ
jgi:hypothetical protein